MRIGDLSNAEFVTVAVALLGGAVERVDSEDVAVQVDEIAPGRFNWRKYPERIDLVAVGVALRDAKKERNGSLVVGGNARGWMLSPRGVSWVSGLDLDGIVGLESLALRRGSIRAGQEAERTRLRGCRAYDLYLAGKLDDVTLQDFHQFARVNEYFQSRARERRYAMIENAVVGDDALSDLWETLKARFREEVSGDGET